MRTRLSSTMVVLLVCLPPVACMNSLDGSKIPCTTSDRCPSNYTCVDGYCKHGAGDDGGRASDATRIGDGPRAERVDGRLDPLNPDAPRPGTGDAGTGGASGAGGTSDARDASGISSSAADTGIATTGGNPRDAGEATSANGGSTTGASGSGSVIGTAGVTTSTGAAGAGGTTVTGGTSASGKAGAAGGSSTSGGSKTVTGGTSKASSGGANTSSSSGGASAGSSAGGTVSSGGASSVGGTVSSGGASSSSTPTCQPKPRNCTSTLDNDCNGIPDNQETSFCKCSVGLSRDCQDQYDGIGICKKGQQPCLASNDKTTSNWGDCSGFVAPSTEVCDANGADENCDNRSNENCECVDGKPVPCECGSPTTCTNGKKGTCAVSKVTLYQDEDGDDYGDPARPSLVCPGSAGYVSNANDCDDGPSGASIHPGATPTCSTDTEKRWCPNSGGIWKTEYCDYGCMGGECRPETHGTIGIANYVSCTESLTPRCNAAQGCNSRDGICGTAENFTYFCDGPSDCPAGQKCWHFAYSGIDETKCAVSAPANYYEVCDPLAPTCDCHAYDGYLHICY